MNGIKFFNLLNATKKNVEKKVTMRKRRTSFLKFFYGFKSHFEEDLTNSFFFLTQMSTKIASLKCTETSEVLLGNTD